LLAFRLAALTANDDDADEERLDCPEDEDKVDVIVDDEAAAAEETSGDVFGDIVGETSMGRFNDLPRALRSAILSNLFGAFSSLAGGSAGVCNDKSALRGVYT